MSGLTRRAFLQTGLAGTGTLLLGCRSVSDHATPHTGAGTDTRFDSWLAISESGEVRLYLDRVEMGQGTTTGYATLRKVLGRRGRDMTEFQGGWKRYVLRLRFGLWGSEELSLREIGERLGLSRERVRRIEQDALVELRDRAPALRELLGD